MKKFILAVATIMLATNSFSQISFGVKAGASINNISFSSDDESTKKQYEAFGSTPSFHVGAYIDYNLTDMFAIESGLTLDTRGTESNETTSFYFGDYHYSKNVKNKLNIFYLDIPVNARLNFHAGNSNIYGLVGPTFGIGLGGKSKVEIDGEKDSSDIEFGSGPNDLKRMNVGLLFGAGMKFGIGLGFRLGYNLGLSNLSNADALKAKAGSFQMSLTYEL